MDELAVELKDVTLSLSGRVLFDHVSMDFAAGRITAVMGPSGVGKTTLLRLLSGQLKPDSGQVFVLGEDINALGRKAKSQLRKRLGYLFQAGALFTDHNVFDNVAFALREHTSLPKEMVKDLVLMKLQAVGLRGASRLSVAELSGGMARRVALARAVAMDPAVIFYDEPLAGQDPINTGVLTKLIRSLNRALGITSIIVSHDVAQVSKVADYVFVLASGKVAASGQANELLHTENAVVEQFVQGLPDGPIAFEYPAKPIEEELLHE